MKTRIVVLAAALFVVSSAWGYMDGYAPFTRDHKPKPFPVRELKHTPELYDQEREAVCRATEEEPKVRLKIHELPDRLIGTVWVEDAEGNRLVEDVEIPWYGTSGAEVYEGLFNEDKKPDYVVSTWGAGCGLAGCFSYVSFLLSTEDSYRVISLYVPCFGRDDFVDVNGDDRLEFIHTSFIHGGHNYWVHNLVHFKGDKMVSANRLDWRFPCWVWFTDKENHQNTTKLTKERKKKLWLKEAPDLFPGAEKFADEQ